MRVLVRESTEDDRRRILAFHKATASFYDDIVDHLFMSGQMVTSCVALQEEEVMGHIMASKAHLNGAAACFIAPLTVKVMGQGIGTALMEHLLARLKQAQDIVIALAPPSFLEQFGFQHISAFGHSSAFPQDAPVQMLYLGPVSIPPGHLRCDPMLEP